MPMIINDDDAEADIHIRPVNDNTQSSSSNFNSNPKPAPRTKSHPLASEIRVPFSYSPSPDGTDENLLILLHGLGDTHIPFGKLGQALKLPQTATLALRAPSLIPFLPNAFQWYPSFDPLGESLPLAAQNPTDALTLLLSVLEYLTGTTGGRPAWPANRIHLFGFAQGGTIAAEACLAWSRQQAKRAQEGGRSPQSLGSLITVSGPLLSFPTTAPCLTPVLFFHRPLKGTQSMSLRDLKRGFISVREVAGASQVKADGDEGEDISMPRGQPEWEPIMRFWSEQLARRSAWAGAEMGGDTGLYEVVKGGERVTVPRTGTAK
ncbi:hypothetical protein BJ138DRAFT_63110 [Hygrophoropsis aurantiaca]|uniref:Uncharacterized protein n=1 Tax=Hygrophoropsis aurantiaca TaxID=72124 RepID=A0ACB8ACE8_9AGAM|nr:hypothetical protein BJ138DRAFT_63110 [Hygrophoropsis aurantiaca]